MFGRVLIVTDRRKVEGDLVPAIAALLRSLPSGAAVLQLREKDLRARELEVLARRLLAVTREHDCPLLVNDRVDVALAIGADGVHLPEAGLDVGEVRKMSSAKFLVGVSTHSVAAAGAAARAGADLVVFGPVFDTPTKRRFGPPLGVHALKAAVAAAGKTPVFAIGGIQEEAAARTARAAGAHGVAAIRAFVGSRGAERAAAFAAI